MPSVVHAARTHARAPNSPPVVLLSDQALRPFLLAAARQYSTITPDEPRPCFARQEFAEVIVPTFGAAYENPVRVHAGVSLPYKESA